MVPESIEIRTNLVVKSVDEDSLFVIDVMDSACGRW